MSSSDKILSFISSVYNAPRWIKFVSVAWIFMIAVYISDRQIPSSASVPDSRIKGGMFNPPGIEQPIIAATQTIVITQTAQVLVTVTSPATVVASPVPAPSTSAAPEVEKTIITYVYSESPESRENLIFFLAHALHAKADFVFILNGETDAQELIPTKANIKVVKRPNSCYDLGAHAEVLTKDSLYTQYGKFILLNASVRGPFMPHWADACWSDRFTSKITDEVKLVGIMINCWPTIHIQSMVWATDRAGMELLLYPPKASPRHDEWMEILFSHPDDFPRPADYKVADPTWVEKGLNQCFANRQLAVEAEISATGIILGAGKKIDVMLMKFQTESDYVAHCKRLGVWDPSHNGAYDGVNVHPHETLFFKTNRGIDPRLLELQTEWINKANYSSYDHC